ncbi:hypothetical protein C1J03_07240 [Sulfitobacter sp. SK012]|nr:hypothetical protein C1J03_07240 [Sulfitobacter sp. SK012]
MEKIWNHQLGQLDCPCFARDLFLQSFAPAAVRMNGRFSRCTAAKKIYAVAAISALRAHAAQNQQVWCGLFPVFSRALRQGPVQ